MGNFGEQLRMERVSRGVQLEQIMAMTKISRRHLLALEQERFRLLPGGILSKGIVRGYAGALGLDPNDWTRRFIQASSDVGENPDEKDGWTEFASNVGRARILSHDAAEVRLRWLGAILLLLTAFAASFLIFRAYGLHAGWWNTLLPTDGIVNFLHNLATKAAVPENR